MYYAFYRVEVSKRSRKGVVLVMVFSCSFLRVLVLLCNNCCKTQIIRKYLCSVQQYMQSSTLCTYVPAFYLFSTHVHTCQQDRSMQCTTKVSHFLTEIKNDATDTMASKLHHNGILRHPHHCLCLRYHFIRYKAYFYGG